MEQNTETKTETKLKPEEMPEYQDKLSQSLIRGWRKQFPEWTGAGLSKYFRKETWRTV